MNTRIINTKALVNLLAGMLLATAAQAQVQLTITGSTAFRSVIIDRIESALYDPGSVTKTINGASSLGNFSYYGTMSNATTLGSIKVKVRMAFSGSAQGMIDVNTPNPVTVPTVGTDEPTATTTNLNPDLALSDVFPGSASPPLSESAFDRLVLGVVPFVFMCNNAMSGVTGITRDQAVLLMTASGVATNKQGQIINGMPATYLGGSSPNPVYLIGRTDESGTRISVERDIQFTGNPTLWATNGAGQYFKSPGYSSGGLVRTTVAGKSDAIGYVGLADYNAVSNSVTKLNYEGVPCTQTTVQNGQYAMWGYEHIVNNVGGLSANQTKVRDALISAITNSGYQGTNSVYTNAFVNLNAMQVERGDDGGTITSKNF